MTETRERRKIVRLTLLLLLLAFLTCFAISGTLSKYITTATQTSTAQRVAKFDVGATFNLFDTLKEENTTTAETDVTGSNVIAPGTGGIFTLNLTNNGSEVTVANGDVTFTVTNGSNIPLEYSVDGGTTWTSSLTTATAAQATSGIKWRWPFGNSSITSKTDTTDNGLAAGTATVTVGTSMSITQVD